MVFGTAKMSKPEDFLPYEIGYLTPETEKIAEIELHESEGTKKRCLEELRERIKSEKNLYVRTDDNYLLSFLRGRKYNVDRAFKSIQNCFRLRKEHRHFYDKTSNEEVHEVFRKNFIGFLPRRDKQGRVMLVVKIGLWDPEEVSRDLLMWTITHCMIHSIEDPATQVVGYTIIVDLNGCGQKHVLQCTPQNIMLLIHSTQACFPGRYKGVHVVGAPKIFSVAYAIVYPFLTSKLKKRIFIHGDDLTSLHKKIPPCVLPEEYGGDLGPFDNKPWHDLILTRNEWCLEQRLYGYV